MHPVFVTLVCGSYYYVITDEAPFTLGCYGPATVSQCHNLYSDCDNKLYSITTEYGTDDYDLDCPCYNAYGSNVAGHNYRFVLVLMQLNQCLCADIAFSL